MTAAKVQLGRLLFYDPLLSSDRTVACATCHSELWGMGDALPLSIGVGGEGPAGPGRTGANLTRRNSQTLWNAAYRERLFWDGRADSLEDQVRFPLEAAEELGRAPEEVAADLRAIPGYQQLFWDAFGDGDVVDAEHMAQALAAFERQLVSRRAPYDQYLAGDLGALDDATIEGMFRFAASGCPDCHTPPRFERETYHDRGIGDRDRGRAEVTGDAQDEGAFRVPTLRNVRETEPYFHDGSVASLDAAVRHELERQRADGVVESFDEEWLSSIVTFIDKALMDRTREPDRPEEVPSGLDVPLDGTTFIR